MDFQAIITDVKGRVETVSTRAQGAAEVSVDTFKQAGDIVVSSAQDLFKVHSEVATDLFGKGKASVEKAMNDGLKAVASNPVGYLPEGREQIVATFNTTVDKVSKSGEKLISTFKGGFEGVTAKINGENVTVAKAKKTVRKTASAAKTTAKKTVRKTTTAAKKATAAA